MIKLKDILQEEKFDVVDDTIRAFTGYNKNNEDTGLEPSYDYSNIKKISKKLPLAKVGTVIYRGITVPEQIFDKVLNGTLENRKHYLPQNKETSWSTNKRVALNIVRVHFDNEKWQYNDSMYGVILKYTLTKMDNAVDISKYNSDEKEIILLKPPFKMVDIIKIWRLK